MSEYPKEDEKPLIKMAEPGEHSISTDLPWREDFSIAFPPTLWLWDVFGGGELIVSLGREASWLFRLRSRIFLGSRWKKEDKA